ncbi:MAG TPA: SDR family oxidoreductase [Burkholderiaceae bacterium]|nr:SDR family oxidoreductase [Burkholderiaceae bacterium]
MQTKAPAATWARIGRAHLGKPRLLIVGCGKVGLGIVARLNRRFRVFATTTTPLQCQALRQAGAVPVVIDLDSRAGRPIAQLAPCVICLVPPPPEGPTDTRIARLLQWLRWPPRRFIYISTTGVYGDLHGAWVDETAPPAPITERARRRVDAERRARAHPWRASVLRVPGIYGPGRLPTERLRRAIPAPLPAEDVLTNHIHIDDLARLCIASLFRAAPRRIYNAVDDSCLRLGDYLDLVADQFALPRAPRLPREALRRAVSPIQFSFFQESRRLRNRRIKKELRMRLQFPTVREGLLAAARAESEPG